jgi:hypothetical protein
VSGIPPTPPVPISANGTITATGNTFLNSLGNLYIPKNFQNAYVSSWNVAIQQALPGDSSLQIAYVANHGTRIDVAQNINIPSVYGQSGTFDPLNIAFGKTASVTQYFLGFSTNYQSLQVQLSRRFTKGIAFSSAITWGKAQNYQTGAQDGALLFYNDFRRNYTVADFDRGLNFEQTVTWEVPAGRGHRYFNSGVGSFILGGWKTSAILSALSGCHSRSRQRVQRQEQPRRSIRLPPTMCYIMSLVPPIHSGSTQPASVLADWQVAYHLVRAWSVIHNGINSEALDTSRITFHSSRAFPSSANHLWKLGLMPSTLPIPLHSVSLEHPSDPAHLVKSPLPSAVASAMSTASAVHVFSRLLSRYPSDSSNVGICPLTVPCILLPRCRA